jgi:hypothetical protein
MVCLACFFFGACMLTPTISNNIEEPPQSLLPSPTSPTILSSITPTRIPHDNTFPTTATSVSQLMPPLEESLRPRYIVTAQLSLLTKSISVSEYIVYTNNSGLDLIRIPLFLPSDRAHLNLFLNDNLDLCSHFDYDWGNQVVWLNLITSLPPGYSITFHVSYTLLAPISTSRLTISDDFVILNEWLLIVPPYIEGRAWLVNPPHDIGEYRSYEKAVFQVSIKITPAPEQPLIVVSGYTGEEEYNQYTYSNSLGRDFTWIAAPSLNYTLLNEVNDNVSYQVLVQNEHLAAGNTTLRVIIQALQLFSKLFGDYPNSSFTAVEAPIQDGIECDGIFLLSEDFFTSSTDYPADLLTTLSVHETAHQWWYALVGNDQANEPWLDEALSTYSELFFYEEYYPFLTTWWWQFRVTRFEPQGKVNTSIYEYEAFRPYVNAVYLRGAIFLDEIRKLTGSDDFYSGLNSYAESCADKISYSSDFRQHFSSLPDDLLTNFFK